MKKITFLTFALVALTNIAFSQNKVPATIDSLKQQLALIKSDTSKVNILIQLAMLANYTSYQESFENASQAYMIADKCNFQKGKMNAVIIKGSICLKSLMDFEPAFKCYMEGIKIAEQVNDTLKQAKIYYMIGYLHLMQKQYSKCEVAYQNALSRYKLLGDKENTLYMYQAFCQLYDNEGKKDSALNLCRIALNSIDSTIAPSAKARLLMELSKLLTDKNDIPEAMESANKAIEIFRNENALNEISYCTLLIARQYQYLQNYSQAIKIADSALTLCKQGGMRHEELDSYEILEKIYNQNGDYEHAYFYSKKYTALKDSIFSQSSTMQIASLEFKYNQDKKDVLVKTAMEKQKLIRNGSLAGIFIAIILLFFVYRNYQKQILANKQLKETQEQLIKSEKLAAFGSVATRMAHEIQNPLNFVNNFSELSKELVDEIIESKTEEEKNEAATILKENLEKINHHGKRASTIVHELQERNRKGTAHEFFEENG